MCDLQNKNTKKCKYKIKQVNVSVSNKGKKITNDICKNNNQLMSIINKTYVREKIEKRKKKI